MEDKSRIWLAGFMDGEGCITVTTSMGHRNINPNYCMVVKTTNTDLRLLGHCQDIAGGSIVKQRTYSPRHKQIWQWVLCANNARSLLLEVLPYLVGKEEVARLAIALQDSINENKQRNKELKPEVVRHRQGIVKQIKALNKRGVEL